MASSAYLVGHGYDLHRLDPVSPEGDGSPFVLGGIRIEHDRGPVGHSDGDALSHAVTDAILGALGLEDIGQLFPDSDPRWENAQSSIFLTEACRLMRKQGYELGNLDATVVLERPKIGPHKDEIRGSLARLMEVDPGRVNLKGKTHEKVDAIGEGRAIEVHVVALLEKSHADDPPR